MEKGITNSEKLHKQLTKLSRTIYEKYFSHIRDQFDYLGAQLKLLYSKEADIFSSQFKELSELGIREEYFWPYCDFKTYSNNYTDRLNEFIKEFGPDVDEIDFIEYEKENIENGFLSYSFPLGGYPPEKASIEISFLDQITQKRLSYSKKRKLKFLENKLKESNIKEVHQKNNQNNFPEIFKPNGYELFCYLNENYSKHDNNLPTKYSNIYRFLEYEQYMACNHSDYMNFIKRKFGVSMSKILNSTLVYQDKIKLLLTHLKSEFLKEKEH